MYSVCLYIYIVNDTLTGQLRHASTKKSAMNYLSWSVKFNPIKSINQSIRASVFGSKLFLVLECSSLRVKRTTWKFDQCGVCLHKYTNTHDPESLLFFGLTFWPGRRAAYSLRYISLCIVFLSLSIDPFFSTDSW